MADVHTRTTGRGLEIIGLLTVLAALAFFLVTARSIMPSSDPANWFVFGRNFIEQFGHTRLAYGFPLLVAAVIQVTGPFYAFLINVPLLLILTLLIYVFTRRLMPEDAPRAALVAPFGAALAVLFFVQHNAGLLSKLSNPYRDPLSHVLVLLACVLLVGFRRGRARSLGPVVVAGLLMAYACSTRETAALMLLPLILYATMAKLEDRALPYWKVLLAFGVAFTVGIIPLLVENQLVSGNFLVPAQASQIFERRGDLIPGVRLVHFADTFPAVVNHLQRHFGVGPLLLFCAGFVAALRYRAGAVLYLCVPVIVIYTLFYGSYHKVVPRYLFVVDLFALPVAGFGAAALFHIALGALRHERARRWVAQVGLAAVLILAATTALKGARFAGGGFRLAEARRLVQDIAQNLPPDARVIGDQPLGQILSCFLDQRTSEVRMFRRRDPLAAAGRKQVRHFASTPGVFYAATTRSRVRQLLASEFDLEPVVVLPARRYRLEGKLSSEEIRIDRVLPWTHRKTQKVVRVAEAGEHLLRVDVGPLSKERRGFARLLWGGEVLDDALRDGLRYYRVRTEIAGPVVLELESDRPVPGSLRAWIGPIAAPLRLDFDILRLMDDVERFSDGFLVDPYDYPEIPERGSIDVPTVGWEDGYFVFTVGLRIDDGPPGWKRRLTIRSGGVRLFDAVLTEGLRKRHRIAYQKKFVFWAAPGVVTSNDTRLDWSLSAPVGDANDRARLWIRDLVVYRLPPADLPRIDVGSTSDGAFIEGGFYERESSNDGQPLRWRWTNGWGRLRLFAWPEEEPLRLFVRTLQGARPAGIASPAPRFELNGQALTGATRREPVGELERVTYRFDLPPARIVGGMNLLEIRSRSWDPARSAAGAERRSLGIMLESVSLEPLPAG